MNAQLRVAMFTPLPPARTGTADYAAGLMAELQKLVRLEVFRSPIRPNPKAFDAVIYQIANNPHHAEFYRLALETSGIVVVHEVNLHDLVKDLTLHRGGVRPYLDEVLYEIFGCEINDPGRRAAVGAPQPRTFTVLRRLLDRSRACIVHSAYAEREVRLKGFRQPVAVIPHGSDVRNADGRRYRESIGARPTDPILGIFGYQRPDKQTFTCLNAFAKLSRSYPNAHLIVVGESHPEVRIEPWIRESECGGSVHVLGFQTLEDFDGYLGACDIVLNLRHPTFGETSGTMMRAFGLGRTVIVSESGACRELPNDVCIRIEPDLYEAPVLVECLNWLLEDPSRLKEIGARAQAWVGERCSWRGVAESYAEFARLVANGDGAGFAKSGKTGSDLSADGISQYVGRWVDSASDAGRYYRTHQSRLVRTVQMIPPGRPDDRILELGCYLQITPALRRLLGYGEVRGCYLGTPDQSVRARAVAQDGEVFECEIDTFDAEVNPFPYPDGYFSVVVCGELLEHLQKDPMHMMSEIHRILKPSGLLVLTTPNAVSLRAVESVMRGAHPALCSRYGRVKLGGIIEPGHSREYTPDEIRLLLEESGFVALSIETGPYGEPKPGEDPRRVAPALEKLGYSTVLRDDCIHAVGRKESLIRKRFPLWLYSE